MIDKHDIAIAYRIYPGVSKVPPVYSDNKYKLSELCLKSFKRALEGVNAYLYVIFDNCPEEYHLLFDKVLDGIDKEYIDTQGIGNGATFKMQMDILLNQDKSDIIYFAEDDYFYLRYAFTKMIKLISEPEIDFITPFEHPDYYNLLFHKHKRETKVLDEILWRSGASTTMTFMTRKEKLLATQKVFETYAKNNYDGSLWSSLTKYSIRNPIKFLRTSLSSIEFLKIYAKAYLHSFSEVLFGKKYKLYFPKPSLSCHMDDQHMAPDIDWLSKFKEIDNGL